MSAGIEEFGRQFMNNNFRPIVQCLYIVLLLTIQNFAQNPDSIKTLMISKINSDIRIDGRLDESEWQTAASVSDFTQREPSEGQPVSERTEVKLMYDEANLYIAFRCFDSQPDQIVANEMRRDQNLLNNDCIEIFLDTFHDSRNAFYFCTNPLGAQRDALIAADSPAEAQNWDWNGVWMNASNIDSGGWTAEIAIPFQTLRFKDGNNLTWGVNFARYIARKREEVFWSPILRSYGISGKFHISGYGQLNGLDDLRQPANFEFKPFILTGIQRDFENRKPYQGSFELGLDVKYHLTSNLTADITLNTDFAQVEADQEQANLTRFELFYPEKREFFLEGANMFYFGERSSSPTVPANTLFFSRRIGLTEDNERVPLLGGVKVTGKTGNYNLGLMNILTDRIRYVNDDGEPVKTPRTNYSVLRLRRDILSNSYIGAIALNQQSLDDKDFNRDFGLDAAVYLNSNTQLSGFAAKTYSHDSDLKGKDFAFYGDFLYNNDFWYCFLGQNSIQENFNPEMGFSPRTGIRGSHANVAIAPRPGILSIRQTWIFDDFYYYTDQSGRLETRQNFLGVYNVFENGAEAVGIFSQNYERLTEEFEIHDQVIIQPDKYQYSYFWGMLRSDESRALSGMIESNFGKFYDGSIVGLKNTVNVKLSPRLTVNLRYDRNDVHLSAGNFITDIIGARILYTFTPKLFAKAFIQWNSDEKTVNANFLVNFIHRPGSDLYLVYNEEMARYGQRFRSNNRIMMLKLTYLLVR